MRRFAVVSIFLGLLLSTGALGLGSAAARTAGTEHWRPSWLPSHRERDVCSDEGYGKVSCFAKIVTELDGASPLATSSYQNGYDPSDLARAYKWADPVSSTWNPDLPAVTIAIVDAYDNPNAYADLTTYRAQFGLPPCTTDSGCFRKVNQNGQASPLPAANTGWGQEIDLDIEMASAVCPQCSILLVEASSTSIANLGTAVNRAVAMGASAISNSYGTSGEFSGETSSDSYYNHPGVAITASTGDSGYGVSFPAASNHVVAVGGTSLREGGSARGFTESAWSGAGSGCSAYFAKPSWQTDTGCARRTVADVSAVADPSTGVAVYDSYGSSGDANWYVFGGTSVSAPIVASAFALAHGATSTDYPARLLYANPGALFDASGGSNGSCSPAYLCNGVAGFDGPTGLGTPNGLAAFTAGSSAPTPDFSLAASPASQSVTQGASASYTVNVTPSNGFAASVALGASGLPAGASASFSPTSPTSSTLTISTAATTPAGSYTITITGNSGSLTHTTTATLNVTAAPAGDFSLGASPGTRTVTQGASASYTVNVTPSNGFAASVALGASGLPAGASASFSPTSPTSSTLTISTAATTPAGSYTITITGNSGSLTHTTTATLNVTAAPAGDFSISVSPSSRNIGRNSTTSYTVTITRLNGFSGSVSLGASGLPSGLTASFSSNPATTKSTLTLRATRLTRQTSFTVTITGSSGSLSHSTALSLSVN